jgi:hypothetical protein
MSEDMPKELKEYPGFLNEQARLDNFDSVVVEVIN